MTLAATTQPTKLVKAAPWIIAGLMVLSTLLSLAFFQRQSLRLDEAQSLWQTSHGPAMILKLVGEDVHVPLYHLILHVWQLFFGNDVSLARLLSFFFFLLSIPLMYALGRLCYDVKTSLFTTALFVISPFMNWYANEIRMYSLLVFMVLLNQYFFVSIFKKKTTGAWIGFTITAILGMYTHYFFFLILLADLFFYFYNRRLFLPRSLPKFFGVFFLLVVLFTPWVLYVLYLGSSANSAPSLAPPTTVNVFNTFSEFLFGFQTDHLNTILVSLWPLTILLAFLALRKNEKLRPETIYFLIAFLLPNIVAFAVSIVVRPVYLSRYLIFTLPSMYFVVAWLLGTYPRRMAIIARTALLVLMAGTLWVEAVSAATPVKENYREAVNYLEEHVKPADVIVVSAPFTIYPVMYYYRGPALLSTLPIWDMLAHGPIPAFFEAELPGQVSTLAAGHENLWLLLSYDQGYQEKVRLYFDTHFERTYTHKFSPGLSLYKYKLRYDR